MFTVGEFSRIARVSKRLLRYYDEIGLFKPVKIDGNTGYRYYNSSQLADINKVIALKELGLSLDEIQHTFGDGVGKKELMQLLTLKKSEIERSVDSQLATIQRIESRLESAENDDPGLEVVIKDLEEIEFINFRKVCQNEDDGKKMSQALFNYVDTEEPGAGNIMFIIQNDGYEDEGFDLKAGFIATGTRRSDSVFELNHTAVPLVAEVLPAEEHAATIVHRGNIQNMNIPYTAIGYWVEKNGYGIAGKWREVLLERPTALGDIIVEVQVPIKRA
jgi:DNA-binding transcriptional MerR regulator